MERVPSWCRNTTEIQEAYCEYFLLYISTAKLVHMLVLKKRLPFIFPVFKMGIGGSSV